MAPSSTLILVFSQLSENLYYLKAGELLEPKVK